MTLHTYSDGGARGNPGPAAIGVVVCDPQGRVVQETAQTIGATTNNVAEYRAMLLAMTLAQARKATKVVCTTDSQLIIYQLQGRYRIKDTRLKELSEKVKALAGRFESVEYRQVPREHPMISRADKLLNQALDRGDAPPTSGAESNRSSGQGELFA